MKKSERFRSTFRETTLSKEKVVAITSSAIGLLIIALIAKYGFSVAWEKTKQLRLLKRDLSQAVESDDTPTEEKKSRHASDIAAEIAQLFVSLGGELEELDWSDKRIRLVQLLSELLRHRGPHEG